MARTRSLIGGRTPGTPKKIGWALVTQNLTAAERSARTKKGWLKRQRARQVLKGRVELARGQTAYSTFTTTAGYVAHPGLGSLNQSTRKRAHTIGASQGQAAHDAFVDYVIKNQQPGQSGASLANLVRKAVAAANNASAPSTQTGSNAPPSRHPTIGPSTVGQAPTAVGLSGAPIPTTPPPIPATPAAPPIPSSAKPYMPQRGYAQPIDWPNWGSRSGIGTVDNYLVSGGGHFGDLGAFAAASPNAAQVRTAAWNDLYAKTTGVGNRTGVDWVDAWLRSDPEAPDTALAAIAEFENQGDRGRAVAAAAELADRQITAMYDQAEEVASDAGGPEAQAMRRVVDFFEDMGLNSRAAQFSGNDDEMLVLAEHQFLWASLRAHEAGSPAPLNAGAMAAKKLIDTLHAEGHVSDRVVNHWRQQVLASQWAMAIPQAPIAPPTPAPAAPVPTPAMPPTPAAPAPQAPSAGPLIPHTGMNSLPSASTIKRAQTILATQGKPAHDAFVNYYQQNYPSTGLSGAALANFGRKAVAAANAAHTAKGPGYPAPNPAPTVGSQPSSVPRPAPTGPTVPRSTLTPQFVASSASPWIPQGVHSMFVSPPQMAKFPVSGAAAQNQYSGEYLAASYLNDGGWDIGDPDANEVAGAQDSRRMDLKHDAAWSALQIEVDQITGGPATADGMEVVDMLDSISPTAEQSDVALAALLAYKQQRDRGTSHTTAMAYAKSRADLFAGFQVQALRNALSDIIGGSNDPAERVGASRAIAVFDVLDTQGVPNHVTHAYAWGALRAHAQGRTDMNVAGQHFASIVAEKGLGDGTLIAQDQQNLYSAAAQLKGADLLIQHDAALLPKSQWVSKRPPVSSAPSGPLSGAPTTPTNYLRNGPPTQYRLAARTPAEQQVVAYLADGGRDIGDDDLLNTPESAHRAQSWQQLDADMQKWVNRGDYDAAIEFIEGLGDPVTDGARSDMLLGAMLAYKRDFEKNNDHASARAQAVEYAGLIAEHQLPLMVQRLTDIAGSRLGDPNATNLASASVALDNFLAADLPDSTTSGRISEIQGLMARHALAYTTLRAITNGNVAPGQPVDDAVHLLADTLDEWDLLEDDVYHALNVTGARTSRDLVTDRGYLKPPVIQIAQVKPPTVQAAPPAYTVPTPTTKSGFKSSNHAPNWTEPLDISQGGTDDVGAYFAAHWGTHGGPPAPGSAEEAARQKATDQIDDLIIQSGIAPNFKADLDFLEALGPSDLVIAAKATYIANAMLSSDQGQARKAALTNATKFAKTNLVQLSRDMSGLGMPKMDGEFSKVKTDLGYIGSEVYAEAALAHAGRYPQDEAGAIAAARQAVADYLGLAQVWGTPTAQRLPTIIGHQADFDPKNARGAYSMAWDDHFAIWDQDAAKRARTSAVAGATQGINPSAPNGPQAPPTDPNQAHMTPVQASAQAGNLAAVQSAMAATQAAIAKAATKTPRTTTPKPKTPQVGPKPLKAGSTAGGPLNETWQPTANSMGWDEIISRQNNSSWDYFPDGQSAQYSWIGTWAQDYFNVYNNSAVPTLSASWLTQGTSWGRYGNTTPDADTQAMQARVISAGITAGADAARAGKPYQAQKDAADAAARRQNLIEWNRVLALADPGTSMPNWAGKSRAATEMMNPDGTPMPGMGLSAADDSILPAMRIEGRTPPLVTGIDGVDRFMSQYGLGRNGENLEHGRAYAKALTIMAMATVQDKKVRGQMSTLLGNIDSLSTSGTTKGQAEAVYMKMAGLAAIIRHQSDPNAKPLTKASMAETFFRGVDDAYEARAKHYDVTYIGPDYQQYRDFAGPAAAVLFAEHGTTAVDTLADAMKFTPRGYYASPKPYSVAFKARTDAIFAIGQGSTPTGPAPSLGTVTGATTTGGPAPWASMVAPDHSIIPPIAPLTTLTVGQKKVLANAVNGVNDPAVYVSVHNAVVRSFFDFNQKLQGAKPTAGQTRQANQDAIGDAQAAATRAARGATVNPDGSINAPPGTQPIIPGQAGALGIDSAPKQPRTGHHNPVIGARRTSDIMDVPVLADPSKDHPAYHIDRPLEVLEDLDKLGVIDAMLKASMNNKAVTPVTKRDDDGSIFNHFLAAMNIVQGFNAEPHVVSSSEIDSYARKGEQKWYRGNGPPAANRRAKNNGPGMTRHPNDQFRDGVYWPGGAGMQCYGYGLYAGSYGTAQGYASGNNGKVLKMSVKKGARTTTESNLNSLRSQLSRQLANDPKWSQPQYAPLRQELTNGQSETLGYIAVLYGYDGFRTSAGTYVIENRGSMRVASQDNVS